MHKSEGIMNLILGIVVSFTLSFLGSVRGGNFSVTSWLMTFLASFILTQMIGFLIPYKEITDNVCKKIKVQNTSTKGILLSALIIDLIYTPIMSGTMFFVMTWILSKVAPGGKRPPMLIALASSLSLSFIVAFVIIALMLPVIYKVIDKHIKTENDEASISKNRLIHVTTILLIISFLVSTLISIVSVDKILSAENRNMVSLLSDTVSANLDYESDELSYYKQLLANLKNVYNADVCITDNNNIVILSTEGLNVEELQRSIDVTLLEDDGLEDENSLISKQYMERGTGWIIIATLSDPECKIIIRRNVDLFNVVVGTMAKNLVVFLIIIVLFIIIATLLLGKSSSILARSLKFESYETLKNVYQGIYVFDINTGFVSEVKNLLPDNKHFFKPSVSLTDQIREVMDEWVDDNSRKVLYRLFSNGENLYYLTEKTSNSAQFVIKGIGWCRGNLVSVFDPKTQKVDHKLFLIEVIESEVRKQNILRKETEAAKAASEAKGRFLANMSHEIRTPINAVLGLDTMILRESSEPVIKEYAANIQTAGNTLLSIINDILDFSKIESGKMDIVPVEYDLSSLINDVINMISIKAEAKKLYFDVNVDKSIPAMLYGDDIRIKQVLLNIMNNAVKYTNTGGITFSISGTVTGNQVTLHFSIKDTGIGIKEEDMDKLFSDFERIEESRNRSVEGTGLGMSISVQLLKLMDSRMQVKSVYGEGSEFFFDLNQDIKKNEPIGDFNNRISEAAKDYEYDASFIAPEAKVLVVDDNEINRVVFANLLKETQIMVDEAEGGISGLDKIINNQYDIIFLDHMMPDKDGTDVLKEFKQMAEEGKVTNNITTPMIVLTANAISGAREQYMEIGFSDYLSKPIIPDKFEKMVSKLIPAEKKIKINP